MSIHDALNSASRFAASRWRAARLEGQAEEMRLWQLANEYRAFIGETGQVYLFEDYLKGLAPSPRPCVSTALQARRDTTSRRVLEFLLTALDESPAPDQRQSALVFIHLLDFIADTGQIDAVEDYVNNHLEHAPLAIAHFMTRAEAEDWLREVAEPPSPARILIGDEYYLVWYSRDEGARGMSRDFVVEPYLEELVARGIPPGTPAFETRVAAEEWLTRHPASPFAFVSIAGEHCLAVHHKRLNCHTLHPVASTLRQWEEKKRDADREKARDAAEDEGEGE